MRSLETIHRMIDNLSVLQVDSLRSGEDNRDFLLKQAVTVGQWVKHFDPNLKNGEV